MTEQQAHRLISGAAKSNKAWEAIKQSGPEIIRVVRDQEFRPDRDKALILTVFSLVAAELLFMEELDSVGMYLRREVDDL